MRMGKTRTQKLSMGLVKWFLQHDKFQEWLKAERSALLWLTADPGCGKSVLARMLVDTRFSVPGAQASESLDKLNVCYFFFKDDSEENKSAGHALCAILHQLFLQEKELLKYAVSEWQRNWKEHPKILPQLFDVLWGILSVAAESPGAGTIVCVLDALDECVDSTQLLLAHKISKYYKDPPATARLKFFITSRPSIQMSDIFWQDGLDMTSFQVVGEAEAEMTAIGVDINIFVKEKSKIFAELRRRKGYDDDAHIFVQEKLSQAENRTYLWVGLMFPELEKNAGLAKKKLVKVLDMIPATLDEAFQRILSRSADPELAEKLLQIVVAAARPLTVKELNLAMSIKSGDTSYDDIDLDSEVAFKDRIRELCGLFVNIKGSNVYLIHQTAREFLVRRASTVEITYSGKTTSKSWKHSLELDRCNAVLAEICTMFLKFGTFGSNPIEEHDDTVKAVREYESKHIFLSYAACYWTYHFRTANLVAESPIVEDALWLCDVRYENSLTWFRVAWYRSQYSHHSIWVCPTRYSDLMIASYFGLDILVRRYLTLTDDLRFSPNHKDAWGQTAIFKAAANGHTLVVQLLLSADNVDADLRDKGGFTPLAKAAKNGHLDTVRLLLSVEDVDPDSREDRGVTPLSWAAENGHESVVKLLLSIKDVDVNSKDNNGISPLMAAAYSRRESVVKILLAFPDVEVNPEGMVVLVKQVLPNLPGSQGVLRLLLSNSGVRDAAEMMQSPDYEVKEAFFTPEIWGSNTYAIPPWLQLTANQLSDLNDKGSTGVTPDQYERLKSNAKFERLEQPHEYTYTIESQRVRELRKMFSCDRTPEAWGDCSTIG
jgi:hypothetical protein